MIVVSIFDDYIQFVSFRLHPYHGGASRRIAIRFDRNECGCPILAIQHERLCPPRARNWLTCSPRLHIEPIPRSGDFYHLQVAAREVLR